MNDWQRNEYPTRPPVDMYVLVYIEDAFIQQPTIDIAKLSGGQFVAQRKGVSGYIEGTVTHWMLLPEAPQ